MASDIHASVDGTFGCSSEGGEASLSYHSQSDDVLWSIFFF